MTGLMLGSALRGGASSVTYSVALGANVWGFKGYSSFSYGYQNGSAGALTNSPAPIPATYKTLKVRLLASWWDNATNQGIDFGYDGIDMSLAPTSVTVNGNTYTFGAPGLSGWITATGITFSNSAGSVIANYAGHGLVDGDMVTFQAGSGSTLPSNITAGAVYYARSPAANYFYLSTTPAGALLTFVTAGSGSTNNCTTKPFVTMTANPGAPVSLGIGQFYVAISVGSPAVFTYTSHGLTNGKRVMLWSTGSLPGGLSANTIYYVVNATANTFNVSLTSGGAAINTSFTGSGSHSCAEVVDIKVT